MRSSKRDGSDERRILTGMIIDHWALGQIVAKWEPGLFKSRWSNIIAGWCVEFFQNYDKAPGKAIEGLFESWASNQDKDTVALVEKFLGNLSGEYKSLARESNSKYLVDLAGKHFNRVKLSRLAESLQGDVDKGNLNDGLKRVAGYNQIEMGGGAGVDVLQDTKAIQEAFAERREPLVKYKGALGHFFGDALERDAFLAFMGPEKRGKTWWLLDMAWRAMLQRRRVAFFEVGDMSQNQIMRRWMTRAAKRPMKAETVKYPTFLEVDSGADFATITHTERVFKKNLDWRVAHKACQRTLKAKIKSKKSMLRLSCHPNSTLTVAGMRSILRNWERAGWVPDIVICDYADILAPPVGTVDSRDQINGTWKQLRAMSQALHCLVVTATQADAGSYNQQLIRRGNFSEDKRKLAHVTGMIGINATEDEKVAGAQRLNWVALREGRYSESRCVHVANCLEIGNPAVLSSF